jgi:hypothetical protein
VYEAKWGGHVVIEHQGVISFIVHIPTSNAMHPRISDVSLYTICLHIHNMQVRPIFLLYRHPEQGTYKQVDIILHTYSNTFPPVLFAQNKRISLSASCRFAASIT